MITRQQPYTEGTSALAISPPVWKAAIYCRLSVDDQNLQESGSIQTQRTLLTEYCRNNGIHIVDCYIDDGVSGTTVKRPAFEQMIADIEAGKVNTVVVKDLSRFGRNYAEAGMFLDHYFVEWDVRFIATQDNVDTLKKGFDISVPMRNIMNDFFAREASQKTITSKRTRAKQGFFMGSKAPYGYLKDPNDHHKLVVDPEAAEIVQRIFRMAAAGSGYNKIARTLRAENIPNPITYYKSKHPEFDPNHHFKDQCLWHVTSIQKILQSEVYLGDMVQCKRGVKGIKGKPYNKDESEWIAVADTHEALVDEVTWNEVQNQITKRRRVRKDGECQIFAGLLYCSTCESALSFSGVKRKTMPDGGVYKCWYYSRHGKEYCTSHYIRQDHLTELVLADIRRHARYAKDFRKQYVDYLRQMAEEKDQASLRKLAKDAEKAKKRIKALDDIIKKLLEQNALGRISDERFCALSAEYEAEQNALKKQVADAEESVSKARESKENAEEFTGLIDKYVGVTELNARILNELIEQIVVHDRVTVDGEVRQQVDIYYKFIGMANIYI